MPCYNARILLVEDLDEDRKLLADFLHQHHYQLYLAPNGEIALTLAQKVMPDLILMDVTMPVCDGFNACKRLKADPKLAHIPIIFLTAASRPEERVIGLKLGAIDYISKPFDFEEVKLRLAIHLKHPAEDSTPTDSEEGLTHRNRLNHSLFRAACDTLLADLAKTPDLQTLATELRTNKKRLNEAFKTCANSTVFEYLRQMRMMAAEKRLRESLLDIAQIASEVGFKNPANFSTAFRQHYGVSPKDYRNRSANLPADNHIDP
jgi:DNA-binding response OmpR family regulator